VRWDGSIPCHEFGGVLYVEVPKAAATSIKAALGEVPEGEDPHRWLGYIDARDPAQLQAWLLGRWAKLFRFTVVRHPVARFESYFYGHVGGDINAFIQDGFWDRDVHAVPQTAILGEDLAGFDFVGRVEAMDLVQRRLRRTGSVPSRLSLPHLNASVGKRQRLGAASRRVLEAVYRRDFEVLGYG